jgi:hypothetical protein
VAGRRKNILDSCHIKGLSPNFLPRAYFLAGCAGQTPGVESGARLRLARSTPGVPRASQSRVRVRDQTNRLVSMFRKTGFVEELIL